MKSELLIRCLPRGNEKFNFRLHAKSQVNSLEENARFQRQYFTYRGLDKLLIWTAICDERLKTSRG